MRFQLLIASILQSYVIFLNKSHQNNRTISFIYRCRSLIVT